MSSCTGGTRQRCRRSWRSCVHLRRRIMRTRATCGTSSPTRRRATTTGESCSSRSGTCMSPWSCTTWAVSPSLIPGTPPSLSPPKPQTRIMALRHLTSMLFNQNRRARRRVPPGRRALQRALRALSHARPPSPAPPRGSIGAHPDPVRRFVRRRCRSAAPAHVCCVEGVP